MLALDEPTTNLDMDNVKHLAEGLVELVNTRKQQSNFQLVVITHDEKFVDILSKGCRPEHHYVVEKDRDGYSRLKKCTELSDMEIYH